MRRHPVTLFSMMTITTSISSGKITRQHSRRHLMWALQFAGNGKSHHDQISKSRCLIQFLRRNLSAGITKEERDIAVHRLSVYEKWCLEKILQIGTHNTIILIPIENMTPRYRDEPLGWVSEGKYFIPGSANLFKEILQSCWGSDALRGSYLESTRVYGYQ